MRGDDLRDYTDYDPYRDECTLAPDQEISNKEEKEKEEEDF